MADPLTFGIKEHSAPDIISFESKLCHQYDLNCHRLEACQSLYLYHLRVLATRNPREDSKISYRLGFHQSSHRKPSCYGTSPLYLSYIALPSTLADCPHQYRILDVLAHATICK